MPTLNPKWVAQAQFEVDDDKPLEEMMRCTGVLMEYHPYGDGYVEQERSIFVPGDDNTVTAMTQVAAELNLLLRTNKITQEWLDRASGLGRDGYR